MKRRAPSEVVEPFRRRNVEPRPSHLTEALEGWAAGAVPALETHLESIELPPGSRTAPPTCGKPLVAIGDLAGGRGPTGSAAAVTLNGQREERDPSLGVQLLRTSAAVFDRLEVDRIASAHLADELVDRGRTVGRPARGAHRRERDRTPAQALRIRPAPHWIDGATHRGYLREDFYDAWMRYLPPPPEDRKARKEP
jgi:hypothetical protein